MLVKGATGRYMSITIPYSAGLLHWAIAQRPLLGHAVKPLQHNGKAGTMCIFVRMCCALFSNSYQFCGLSRRISERKEYAQPPIAMNKSYAKSSWLYVSKYKVIYTIRKLYLTIQIEICNCQPNTRLHTTEMAESRKCTTNSHCNNYEIAMQLAHFHPWKRSVCRCLAWNCSFLYSQRLFIEQFDHAQKKVRYHVIRACDYRHSNSMLCIKQPSRRDRLSPGEERYYWK